MQQIVNIKNEDGMFLNGISSRFNDLFYFNYINYLFNILLSRLDKVIDFCVPESFNINISYQLFDKITFGIRKKNLGQKIISDLIGSFRIKFTFKAKK